MINAIIFVLLILNMLAGGFFLYALSIELWNERVIWTSGLLLQIWLGQFLFFRALKRGGSLLVGLVPWLSTYILVQPMQRNDWLSGLSIGLFVIAVGIYLYRFREPIGPLFLYGLGVIGNVLLLSDPTYSWNTLLGSGWLANSHLWQSLYCLVLSFLLVLSLLNSRSVER